MVKLVDAENFIKLHPKFIDGVRKLYGPLRNIYIHYRKDGRRICVVYLESGKLLTKQYARFKMEVKLGRKIPKDYTVDHKDGNKLHDKYANLQVITRQANSSKGAKRRKSIVLPCQFCKEFFPLRKDQLNKRSAAKSGPFCSRSCSGSYGKMVQATGKTIPRLKYKVSYIKGV